MKAVTTTQPELRKGLIEIEIGGRKRQLKFGLLTLIAFSQLHTNQPDDFAKKLEEDELMTLIGMTYCGLLSRKAVNELPEDFSLEMATEWIDDMTLPEWGVVQTAILEAMVVGNGAQETTTTKAKAGK